MKSPLSIVYTLCVCVPQIFTRPALMFLKTA